MNYDTIGKSKTNSPERAADDLYAESTGVEPKLITNFVPANAVEQRQVFLNGEVANPKHSYSALDGLDITGQLAEIDTIGEQILDAPDLNPKFTEVYSQFIDKYRQKTRLLELVREYNHAETEEDKARIGAEYMQLNIDLYGAPQEETYRSLLAEKLNTVAAKQLDGEAARVRTELFELIDFEPDTTAPERFRPSPETVEWMHGVVESLYGGMLEHIPEDKEPFSVAEAQDIFTEIITDEFGEAAEGWRIDVEAAKSINVKSTEKRIVIPEDRGSLSRDTLRKLVVHEIGVHMKRAVTGAETDLPPLANGLSEYYDAEEGLGVVMEQALAGKATDRGVDHYLTAGLAYHDKKDFRGIFEVKWRLAALEKLTDGGELSAEQIEKTRNTAYSQTMRIMSGTDELLWFKDLAYYNGSNDVWRHLEEIRGDDLKFMFVLMGKANPANSGHERIMYETRTA